MPVNTYTYRDEVFYVAGIDEAHARERMGDSLVYGNVIGDTAQEAYDLLGYFDRDEYGGEYQVYKFARTEKVTLVEPPYRSVV